MNIAKTLEIRFGFRAGQRLKICADNAVPTVRVLSRAYSTTITNGTELKPEEMIAKGVNTSLEHHDVTIGSNEVDISGIFANGSVEPLMRAGKFMFKSV